MEGFMKNINRPSNENRHYPSVAVKEMSNFTSSLLRKTRSSLKEDDVEEAVNKLIAEAEDTLKEEEKKKSEKRKNFLKVLSSAISSSKNVSPTPSTSCFKPSSVSTPKSETTPPNQENEESTSKTKPAPKGKSHIPIFQRKCSSLRETKTVKSEVSPHNLSVSRRVTFSTSEFTPKREFRSKSKVSSSKIQVIPHHLCETRYGKANSSFLVKKEKSTTKRKFELRTDRTSTSWAEDLDPESDGIKNDLKCLRDSLQEMVINLSFMLNKK